MLTNDLLREENFYFPLPPAKMLNVQMTQIDAVVLSISGNAINKGMALNRLEAINNHARHMVIDRDGSVFQTAQFDQAIRHLPETRYKGIDCRNSIGVELINIGPISKNILDDTAGITARDLVGEWRVNIADLTFGTHKNILFEEFAGPQISNLVKFIAMWRKHRPLRVINISHWNHSKYIALPPVFPKPRISIE